MAATALDPQNVRDDGPCPSVESTLHLRPDLPRFRGYADSVFLAGRIMPTGVPGYPFLKGTVFKESEVSKTTLILGFRPTCLGAAGNGYRFNGPLLGDYSGFEVAEDPVFNLGLKKESWLRNPARFVPDARVCRLPLKGGQFHLVPPRCEPWQNVPRQHTQLGFQGVASNRARTGCGTSRSAVNDPIQKQEK